MNERSRVESILLESSRTILRLRTETSKIAAAGRVLGRTLRRGRAIWLFGNGGSAADAQHIAAELEGRFMRERRALPVTALTTNASALTAIGNDYGYERTFARLVEAHVRRGDAVIAISTSGNSPNVLAGVRQAKKAGAVTIGFTNAHGGKLRRLVDHCLQVPSRDTQRVQEGHITLGHILCDLVESALFG